MYNNGLLGRGSQSSILGNFDARVALSSLSFSLNKYLR